MHNIALADRLQALRDYDVLDPFREPEYDNITRLVGHVTGAPIGIISLVGEDRQWFKSCFGVSAEGSAIEDSICAHTILGTDPFVIYDAQADPRFAKGRLVTGEPHIRMYAGFPLITPDGIAIGSLCAISPEPGSLTEPQVKAMTDLAALTIRLFEERKLANRFFTQNQMVEDVMNSVSSIMMLVAADGKIARFNQAASTVFGVDASAVVGKTLAECEEALGWPSINQYLRVSEGQEASLRLDDITVARPGAPPRILGFQVHPIWSKGVSNGYFINGADITERRAQEAAVLLHQERYRSLVERMDEVVFQTNRSGQLVFLNAAWMKVTGFRVEESLGKTLDSFVLPEDRSLLKKALSRLLQTDAGERCPEIRIVDQDGTRRWVEVHWQATAVPTRQGESVEGTIRDVTLRKKNEAAEAGRLRLEQLLASVSSGFIASKVEDLNETVHFTFKAICSTLRLDRIALYLKQESGLCCLQCEHLIEGLPHSTDADLPISMDRLPTLAKRLRDDQGVFIGSIDELESTCWPEAEWMKNLGLESQLILPLVIDGRLGGFLSFGTAHPSEEWAPEVLGVFRMLTSMIASLVERTKTEEAFRSLHERKAETYRSQLNQVMATAPIILFSIKKDGEIGLWEGKGLDSLGHRSGQLVGKNAYTTYGTHIEFRNAIETALAGHTCRREIRFDLFTFEMHLSPVVDANGEVSGLIGVGIDVTERVLADETLRVRDQAISAARNGIVITDATQPDNPLVYVNATFLRVTGYSAEEVLGKNCRFLQGNDRDQEALAELRTAIKAGRECRVTLRNFRKDGTLFWNDLTVYPVFGSHGQITNFVGVQNDITERRSLESELAQHQKMETIGELSAGIAHEINTPMQYIGDNLRFIRRAFVTANPTFNIWNLQGFDEADKASVISEVPLAFQQTLEGIERVSKIVTALKEFSHPGTVDFVDVDIARSILGTMTIARNEWKYCAELTTDFAEDLPLVSCLPVDFNQVILNLIINAVHAIGDRIAEGKYAMGSIRISAAANDEWLEVKVADNGGGIPESVANQVFNPFFTTKEVGKGTGQGLAISRKIIEDRHHGKLTFISEPGVGTTFVVRIPLSMPSVQLSATKAI